jgi:hypothetical protein
MQAVIFFFLKMLVRYSGWRRAQNNQHEKLILKLCGIVPVVGTPIDLSYGGGLRVREAAAPVERMEYNEYWRWVWSQTSKK